MTDERDDERFRLTVTVSDEDAVLELADTVEEVHDVGLVDGGLSIGRSLQSSVRVDLESLTPKQWEALVLAFEKGYYDQPRSVDLETLATELSISKSAVSQRLRSAESAVVGALLEGIRTRVED